MALCHLCKRAFISALGTIIIHDTCQSFLAAVDEGCYICQGLFIQVPESLKQELRRHAEASESLLVSEEGRKVVRDGSPRQLTQYIPNSQQWRKSRSATVFLNLSTFGKGWAASLHEVKNYDNRVQMSIYPIAAERLIFTFTSLSTSSEETFTKVRAWLSRCEKTHVKCRHRRDEADVEWHPTRLIQISSESESSANASNLRCRVVERTSEDMPQNLRYITLSHRWPKDQQGLQKLTVDNLPLWKACLPVKMLRHTFRDAFLVAQRLGISYVWIDTLCIIQDGDNHTDWENESPMMQKVYSNAEFNICASKNDQNGGLFSSRKPPSPQPLQMNIVGNDDFILDKGYYLIRKEWPIHIWDARMEDSPLASRGWVFQEQLLSRANLHFGDQEVLFECLEMRATESLGSDQDYDIRWKYSSFDNTFFKQHLPVPTVIEELGGSVSSDERSGLSMDHGDFDDYKHWHDLLSLYTALELTRWNDRLVALSGVAQYFQNSFSQHDCYIAGLWRNRLATEMLWQLTDGERREDYEKRKKARRHLTFSWASVEGKVEGVPASEFIDHLADLEVIKYRMSADPMPVDAFGGKGQPFAEDIFSLPSTPTIEIRLTGFLRPIVLKERLTPDWWIIWAADLDLVPSSGPARLDFDISSSKELNALNTSGRLFCIPLVAIGTFSVWLLLLELVETSDGKDMGRFRRIGVNKIDFGPWRDSEWLTKKLRSGDSVSKLPCWRYDDNSKQHTIFVI